MKSACLALCLTVFVAVSSYADDEGTHLFILSGQSNMAGLNPDLSFTPTVNEAFGEDNVIVVKSAQGGQPIRRWYRGWAPEGGEVPDNNGDLYDRLMGVVRPAIEGREIASVTFVWMQGERDARESHGGVYADALIGLHAQLEEDLERDDIHFVIGRLSDFDNDNARYPHWTRVREAQVQVGESSDDFAWVDTDDLNGNNDGLHYNREGYVTLGTRFAEAAIELVQGE